MFVQREWRRRLPHLERAGARQFLTFSTYGRWTLPSAARDIVLQAIVQRHGTTYGLVCTVVMPDHVHMIFQQREPLSSITRQLKGASAHSINQSLGRQGKVWDDSYFDRIVRSSENLLRKAEYVVESPVRAKLVASIDEYPWIWRVWREGGDSRFVPAG